MLRIRIDGSYQVHTSGHDEECFGEFAIGGE